MTVATYDDRLYGVPLYADVSALFYNKDLFEKAGLDPEKPPTSLAETPRICRQDHRARRRREGLLPARLLRRLQHLHRRPADLGLRRQDRGRRSPATSRSSATSVPAGARSGLRDMAKAGNVHEDARAENGETFAKRFGSGKIGMMGTGNFNITLAREPEPGHEVRHQPPAGPRAGLDRLVHRRRHRGRPEGLEARRRRGRLHEVPPVGRGAGRGLRQAPQPHHPRAT